MTSLPGVALTLALALILEGRIPAQAQAQQRDCPAAAGPARAYHNERFGFGFRYPPVFFLDPQSVPPEGDSARFWTEDRRATAVVNAAPNREGRTLRALLREAEGDVVENSGGEITYRRTRDNWFVISGYMVGRIFYRRTLLARSGTMATLWMEFPREMRDCLDGAVTMMSLSFRER
ncbi:MAG TPA: hypothetical protein VGN83_11525 [Falsiroseomonas sp.]|jgi:hypothetical protein|nr:hypothetical protein [Falsiroseomonas sp.]